MKLLVVTQTVDRTHPVLGFFHRWLEEFASRFESIDVICLGKGVYRLPANVRVHSLGKEEGKGKLVYILRFLSLIRSLSYDNVFVHMNPEYVLLAGAYWRSKGKKVALWYNHEKGGVRLALAALFATHLFHTSPYAASARFSQAHRMPAGIDTDVFVPQPGSKVTGSIYFQGRIAPAKKVHILLEAVRQARMPRLSIVGPEEQTYARKLRTDFADLIASGIVSFLGPKPNAQTPVLYASHMVSVNLTAAGNYDKTVLESLSCGTPVIVSSPAFKDIVPPEWVIPENDAHALAEALQRLGELSKEEYDAMAIAGREKVRAQHSLPLLADRLAHFLS